MWVNAVSFARGFLLRPYAASLVGLSGYAILRLSVKESRPLSDCQRAMINL